MKQTSIEWLIRNVNENIAPKYIPKEVIEQAKEMHKEEIENAYWEGGQDVPVNGKQCEQYYNETFIKD